MFDYPTNSPKQSAFLKVPKYNFDSTGSPVRKVMKNASNESLEELRRAPRKDFTNLSEDRRELYASLGKEDQCRLNFSPDAMDSSKFISAFSS
jgi:hypothetical protein